MSGQISIPDNNNFYIAQGSGNYILGAGESRTIQVGCRPTEDGKISATVITGCVGPITLSANSQRYMGIGTIIERDTSGYTPTFLKKAEIYVTYEGDLTELWTQEKSRFQFVDNVPILIGATKGLANFPFELEYTSIYGIDPVHLSGDTDKWIYFDERGDLALDYPLVGNPEEVFGDAILLAQKSTRPKVFVNNRNHVIVAYESYDNGSQQIEIIGTGDFAADSITGPKAARQTRLLAQNDFQFRHNVTIPSEGLNQLCDLVVDNSDVAHLAWQSSRSGAWEIFYANGKDLFEPVRITKSDSKSGYPSIDLDKTGNVFVVYHDDRYGPYQILLAHKDDHRYLPLLEQDAYQASWRSGYDHYTNIYPINVENTPIEIPVGSLLWAANTTDTFNSIFRVGKETGVIEKIVNAGNREIVSVAGGLTGHFYGITRDGSLYRLSTSSVDGISFTEIGGIVGVSSIREFSVSSIPRLQKHAASDAPNLLVSSVTINLSMPAGDGGTLHGSQFTVKNIGGITPDPMSYSITSDSAWVTTSPTSGSGLGESGIESVDVILVGGVVSGLAIGTHSGVLTVTANGNGSNGNGSDGNDSNDSND